MPVVLMYSLPASRLSALFAACLCLVALVCGDMPGWGADAGWRIRIRDAAVVAADQVLLGEIADAEGQAPPGIWDRLGQIAVMPAPAELGRPMSVAKAKLQPLVRQALGQYEDLCLYPANLAVQRGGSVARDIDLKQMIMREMGGLFAALPGDVSLQDFRLPPYVFLAHPGQKIRLENTGAEPGRNSLRFSVLDGQTMLRRFTGSVMVDVWAPVFCAARPLNRGDTLDSANAVTVRKNLAHINAPLWDGGGGPWMVVRPVGTEQPIYQADITPLPLVRKGNIVTLRYESNTVTLTVKAEAMRDGGAGESIPVRNLQSKRIVHAVIIDSQTALITGGGR